MKHTRQSKKLYLRLVKVMKGRTGKDEKALKETRDKLVKISEKVTADGQAVQAELEQHREKSSTVKGLTKRLGNWLEWRKDSRTDQRGNQG